MKFRKNKVRLKILAVILGIIFFMPFFMPSINAEETSSLERSTEEKQSIYQLSPEEMERIKEIEPTVGPAKKFWDRIFIICDAQVLGLYSKSDNGNGIGGVNADLKFSPSMMLGPKDFLIPVYNGSYSHSKRVVNEIEGAQIYQSFQSHNANLAWRHRFSDELTGKINAFGTWSYTVETRDEDWGKGLYDYSDVGGDVDLRWVERPTDLEVQEYTAGFEYYNRSYPNYHSLISLASVTAPEDHEQNYNGYRLTAGYKFALINGWTASLDCSSLYKGFIDKKIIDSDGILKSDKRNDFVNDIDPAISYNINDNWILGLNNDYQIYTSNQNFYDSRGTVTLNDDVYTHDYYNYYSIGLMPGITYMKEMGPEKKLIATLTYGFTYKSYWDRNVQDFTGNYLDKTQTDYISDVAFNVKCPFDKNWALRFLAEYRNVRSNMRYEQYYLYHYALYNIGGGISYSF